MVVQTMRSGTILQSDEKVSCIGCHEDRLQAPPVPKSMAIAMKRKPSKLSDWYGPSRSFSYTREVQPVFDRHCVKCHDFGKDAGKTLVLCGDRNPYFNASYISLSLGNKKRIKCIGGGPAGLLPPYTWGAHPSLVSQIHRPMSEEQLARITPRMKQLRKKHEKLKLSREDLDRINTWLDLNGPHYPDYLTAYPGKASDSGRSPIPANQINRLAKLTRLNSRSLKNHRRKIGPQISFERPELSPCLQKIKGDPKTYQEALAIIQAGAEALRKKPRCDMPGFVPCETDARRMARYRWLRKTERLFRDAIDSGRKLYDKDIAPWQYAGGKKR